MAEAATAMEVVTAAEEATAAVARRLSCFRSRSAGGAGTWLDVRGRDRV